MSSGIIDIHIHLYRTSEQGHRGKEEYEIWEYGPKDVTLSRFGGSSEEALIAIAEAGAERAVVVNLCSKSSLMEEGKLELPEDKRDNAVEKIAKSLDSRLKASNEARGN